MAETRIIGHCPDELRRPLLAVLERVLANGAPPPSWLTVADGGGWVDLARRSPAVERARAVVLADNEGDLARAVRLGFGGASPLPPSTPAVDAAVRAAAERWTGPPIDPDVVDEILADPAGAWRIGWLSRPAWVRALGASRVRRALVELAAALDQPPVVVEGPCLVVASAAAPVVGDAWREVVSAAAAVPGEPPDVVPASGRMPGHAISRPGEARPVYELPSGRRLGGWWVDAAAEAKDGWLAAPGAGAGDPWRLTAASSIEEIPELAGSEAIARAAGPVVRIPAWATDGLRNGAPAALLLERLAAAARRSGTCLWVPAVDADGLRVLLRLGQTLWVDGPAVPE